MAMELLIIILNPYMMHHFNANELLYAFIFHICDFDNQNLQQLSICNNPLLESLPGSLGHLPSLKTLKLMSNPSLRTPPHEVVSRGFMSIKAYLKRLAGGFSACRFEF